MNAPTEGMELATLLAEWTQAGAYFTDLRDREALMASGNTLHYAVASIDLRGCEDSEMVLAQLADTLQFPDWFGQNWDALADCLNDLSWWPSAGYVLVLEHASEWREIDRAGFDALLEILNEAAARWAKTRVPFWAFFPVPTRELQDITG